jgi:hypothetical protein
MYFFEDLTQQAEDATNLIEMSLEVVVLIGFH